MRTSTRATEMFLIVAALTLVACPRAKDEEGGKDDGARESATGTESGEQPQI
jgi:hypothetical protein